MAPPLGALLAEKIDPDTVPVASPSLKTPP
jgi:hypothetical protein